MRFASHRDIARAVERGVRKAGLPIAYSAGFTPHPKISYAGASATGVASEAEYLELAFISPCIPEDVRDRLDAALPDGIDVIDVTERGSEQRLASLEVSQWQLTLPGVTRAAAQAAIDEFLAASQVEVERLTTKGTRRMDARAAVISMELDRRAARALPGDCEILRMVVRHTTPAVRPDDILAALRSVATDGVATGSAAGLEFSAPPLITRLAQGPLEGAVLAASHGADVPAGTADFTGRQPETAGQEQATRPDATAAIRTASPR
jgi:radical SAM-linked protein